MAERRVLCVGLVCLDVINYCPVYPAEDSDNRVDAQVWALGGNACNNCTILSQLGRRCALFATLSRDQTASVMTAKLAEAEVDASLCIWRDSSELPVSVNVVSAATGSRTIFHAPKSLQEPTFEEFRLLDLKQFDWVHFEGRNILEVRQMMDFVHGLGEDRPKVSVEMEKKKDGMDMLFAGADVVFMSKEFARSRGQNDMRAAVRWARRNYASADASVVCAWGENGAAFASGNDVVGFAPAHPPANVVDTLGAGDTFLAGTLDRLVAGDNLVTAVSFGCQLAGRKCGHRGLLNLPL